MEENLGTMKTLITDLTAIIAMLLIAAVLITCIANNINHGIVYTGLTLVAGLGGYTLGRIITKKP